MIRGDFFNVFFYDYRVTVNLGDNVVTSRGHLILNENLADNMWHKITLTLIGKQLNVTHAGQTTHCTAEQIHCI